MSQFAVSRFCVHVESYHGNRPERIVWTPSERSFGNPTSTPAFPHLVELALPPGGFRSVFLEIDAFHRGRRIPVRRGVDTRPSNSLFDSASQAPPLRMHSATAAVANA